ncbi:hypothetical protein HRbin19_00746 [bacterium HR19]|nr:hypothetical protein HRbin19_00746 [bacterium HR19]
MDKGKVKSGLWEFSKRFAEHKQQHLDFSDFWRSIYMEKGEEQSTNYYKIISVLWNMVKLKNIAIGGIQ